MREALIEFVRLAGRTWMPPDEIAGELNKLARLGVDWPKATVRQWLGEIEGAVADGQLCLDGDGCLRLPLVSEPTVQLLLF